MRFRRGPAVSADLNPDAVPPAHRPLLRACLLPTALFTLAAFLFLTLDWINDHFGTVTFDQLLFVYYSPVAGVDPTLVLSFATRLCLLVALVALFTLLAVCLLRHGARASREVLIRRGLCCGTALLFLASLAHIGLTFNLPGLLARQNSPFIQDHYAVPSEQRIAFPEKKRNLIIILAESAERTFNDRALFGAPIMPELERLADAHLTFTGHVQVPGTEWTIAGITSYLFGMPLRLPLFDWNNYSLFDTFLPGAESLLEVFSREGYEIAMLLGSDSAFSGKRNLFAVHAPQSAIYDLNYFQAAFPDETAANQGTGWGLADAYLFAKARDYLTDRNSDKPFMLILETVDTHSPDPYVAKDFPRQWDDYRDAFAALSHMTDGFVRWLEQQDFFADTTIIILGDHLHMADSLGPVDLRDHRREVYNVFINSQRGTPGANVARSFASFDLCPTILESVGATLNSGRFGLGTSLFQDIPTLLEAVGAEAVIAELGQFSPFYTTFYKSPSRQPSHVAVNETTLPLE